MTIHEKESRLRRSPEAVRAAALASARRLLTARGPEALTLALVARDLGMTHGNLTYHFGTVGALHAALIEAMAGEAAAVVEAAVPGFRSGAVPAREVAAILFRTFAEDGIGRLVAWLAATGRVDEIAPFFAAVERAVARLREGEPPGADPAERGAGVMVAGLVSSALGAALVGRPLLAAAGLAPDALLNLAADTLDRHRATPLPGGDDGQADRSGGIE